MFVPFENISNDLLATQLLEEVNRSGGAQLQRTPSEATVELANICSGKVFVGSSESVNCRNVAIENQQVEKLAQKIIR
jgi:hypothetical protein